MISDPQNDGRQNIGSNILETATDVQGLGLTEVERDTLFDGFVDESERVNVVTSLEGFKRLEEGFVALRWCFREGWK